MALLKLNPSYKKALRLQRKSQVASPPNSMQSLSPSRTSTIIKYDKILKESPVSYDGAENPEAKEVKDKILNLFQKTSGDLQQIKEKLEEYRDAPVSGILEQKERAIKYASMNKLLTDGVEKVRDLGKKFSAKYNQEVEIARKSLITIKKQNTHFANISLKGQPEASSTPDNVAALAEEQKQPQSQVQDPLQQQQQQVKKQTELTMGQRAQIDHIKQVVDDREEDLKRVEAAMGGLLGLAKQVGVETKNQDEKLNVVQENMDGAEENMKMGNEQLHQANTRADAGNKYIKAAVIGVGALVLVLIFVMIIRR
ncbi:hypothetical protein FGO68_gene140 [Halteria grandinella]|uniref:t-SNARE coiled-coil homology domain-containing protein n=1 Tax=Halteria grandinella TaxID=5974 RepID=A0A8J8T1A6_HALGN|nr:hypothetical protein FGO68_gene140 [Halteria grandinella]